MKNSIKLAAVVVALSVGIFATAPAKASTVKTDEVTFSALPSEAGVSVKMENATSKAIVMIYDTDGNVIRKDVLSADKGAQKGYILNKLENGDYTMEVTSNNQVVKKSIHVYDEDNTKTFIMQN